MAVNPTAITIADWKPRASGTLRGFFAVHLPSGLTLNELMLHERNGSWWISFPSKPKLGADGTALRDERGKVRLSMRVVDQATGEDISNQVGAKGGDREGGRREGGRDAARPSSIYRCTRLA